MPSSQNSKNRISELLNETFNSYLKTPDRCEGKLHRVIMNAVEEQLIMAALRHCKGNCSEAARLLGISRTTLMRKKPNQNEY